MAKILGTIVGVIIIVVFGIIDYVLCKMSSKVKEYEAADRGDLGE